MAGGRRSATKSGSITKNSSTLDDKSCESQLPAQLIVPKHVPIPDIPSDGELVFEVLSFFFSVVVLASQYLNLYRSVWWLPHSHTDYALNFYLIDPYVVIFNLIMMGRRLPLNLLKKICFRCLPFCYQSASLQFIRILIITTLIPIVTWCSYNIFLQHGTLSIFCLGYPTVVYLILFGPSILPLFELQASLNEHLLNPKSKSSFYRLGPISHSCSFSAEAIREEVEVLKSDFNMRLKQVLFNSLLVAYYSGFVPCCFAQSSLYYDANWVSQHVGFVWISSFTMYVVYCFPPQYCDILHRSALHLGKWQKVETRSSHMPYNIWSESTIWQHGSLVKYSKELFKAEGIANAAEPGNSAHSRFYTVFSNPVIAIGSVLAVQVVVMALQMGVLVKSSEWNHIISVELLMLLNCLTVFKICREFLVMRKIYHEEQLLQERFIS